MNRHFMDGISQLVRLAKRKMSTVVWHLQQMLQVPNPPLMKLYMCMVTSHGIETAILPVNACFGPIVECGSILCFVGGCLVSFDGNSGTCNLSKCEL